jgi:hypothetical protein
MNSLKKKLKEDAKAFALKPDCSLHHNIMNKIEKANLLKIQKYSWVNHWLLPAGFVAAASLLVLINISKPLSTDSSDNLIGENQEIVQYLDIDSLSLSLESNLLGRINSEKQALKRDFETLKNLYVL